MFWNIISWDSTPADLYDVNSSSQCLNVAPQERFPKALYHSVQFLPHWLAHLTQSERPLDPIGSPQPPVAERARPKFRWTYHRLAKKNFNVRNILIFSEGEHWAARGGPWRLEHVTVRRWFRFILPVRRCCRLELRVPVALFELIPASNSRITVCYMPKTLLVLRHTVCIIVHGPRLLYCKLLVAMNYNLHSFNKANFENISTTSSLILYFLWSTSEHLNVTSGHTN